MSEEQNTRPAPTSATLPERLSIMWQNSRMGPSGYAWHVPIQVTGADPESQAGNVVAIVHLGGAGGVHATQVACETFAKELVDAYNDRDRLAAEVERLRVSNERMSAVLAMMNRSAASRAADS